ncbi:MAG: uroporphyrinogen decarboxylase [Holosporales bacterium]
MKRLSRVLTGEVVNPKPIWLMRQAGRYLPEYRELRAKASNFLDFCYTPEWAIEVTLQPIRRFDLDAAILFSDILVIPHALGQQVTFSAGEGPLLGPLPDQFRDAEAALSHLRPVLETVRGIRQALPQGKNLIGFAGAPWTVFCYMVQGRGHKTFERALTYSLGEPRAADQLLCTLADVSADYLVAQIQAGADVVQLFESWAGVVPSFLWPRLIYAPTKRLVSRLKAKYPDIPIIGFPKGLGLGLADYRMQTGVDALSLDASIPPEWAREHLKCPLQGGVDPSVLVAGGVALEESLKRYLETFSESPFILNLAHGIVPHTPIAHVERMIELVRAGSISS